MGFAHIATALSLSSLSGTDLLFVGLVGGFGLVCLFLWAAWLAGMWKVFVKLGRPGWTCLVPIWSNWQLGRAVGPRRSPMPWQRPRRASRFPPRGWTTFSCWRRSACSC